jgi:hypothetical protein
VTGQQDTAQVARELTAALDRMSSELETVRHGSEERDEALLKYGRTNRRLIRGLIVSLILDIVITVAVGLLSVQAHNNTVAIGHTSASNLALCQASNVARHQQIELWEFLLDLSKGPQTAQQRATVSEFEAHLRAIFAPRRCTSLGQGR